MQYPFSILTMQLEQGKDRVAGLFDPKAPAQEPPSRSPKTSITLAFAHWQRQRTFVQNHFWAIRRIAAQARNTEYRWVMRLISEIEEEIGKVKTRLDECGLR